MAGVGYNESIRSVRLLNTFTRKRFRKQKLGIVDMVAELNDDTKVMVEMQVLRYAFWDRRVLFYLAKMFSEDLWAGEDYQKLKRCISISILDFNLTRDGDSHKVYRLRNEKGNLFSDVFEVHTIELRKKPSEDDPLKEWMEFFNAESEEELDMIQTKNPGLMEAIREIKRLGMGRAARTWYEANQKARRDQRAREEYVREVGWAEGLEEGRAEERKNTEREKEKAEREKDRADQLERKVQELQKELERNRNNKKQ